MNIARLTIEGRSFYLPPDEVGVVMAAAAAARESGEWLQLVDAGSKRLRMLIPTQALLVLEEYEIEDREEVGVDGNDWAGLDYDM
jgi:hypothetical protein